MSKKEKPYIVKKKVVTVIERLYNLKYGDDRICVCGHTYYRHFDGYENNRAVGCKYCQCSDFKEAPPMPKNFLSKKGAIKVLLSKQDQLDIYHRHLEETFNKKN